MRLKILFLCCAATLIGAMQGQAEDAAAGAATQDATAAAVTVDVAVGEGIYKKSCRSCHGPKGKGSGSFPSLLGRDAEFLKGRLMQYKAGEKLGPNSALMIPVAKKISPENIANVAAYISGTFK